MYIATTTPGKVLEYGTDIPGTEHFLNFGPNVFASQLLTKFGSTYNVVWITLAGFIDVISPFNGNDNQVTVTSTGTVGNGINLNGTHCIVVNAGFVGAVDGGEDFHLINSGTMSPTFGGFIATLKSGVVTNSGTMATFVAPGNPDMAIQFLSASNSGTVFNSGLIQGQIKFGGASSSLRNSGDGLIDGAITFGANADSIVNNGFVNGNIKMGNGANTIVNDGFMNSNISMGIGIDAIVNNGFLNSNITTGGGNDYITNRTGRIDGNLTMGAGADVVDSSDGSIRGIIDLGADSDRFLGSKFSEFVIGGLGADEVDLAGGNDRFNAQVDGGDNTVDGGDGIDTYSMLQFTARAVLDLRLDTAPQPGSSHRDSISEFENITATNFSDFLVGAGGRNIILAGAGNDRIDGLGGNDVISGGVGKDSMQGGDGNDVFLDNYAVGDSVDGGDGSNTLAFNLKQLDLEHLPATYTITNVENIRADGTDTAIVTTVKGDAQANDFLGTNSYMHTFDGRDGDDTLDGGAGKDDLTGGLGADVLIGGADADLFRYASESESAPGDFADTIVDFAAGDRIDVSAINANSDAGEDQAFVFLTTEGAAFTAEAQLRFRSVVINDEQYTIVEGNVNANFEPDFQITLFGAVALSSASFIL